MKFAEIKLQADILRVNYECGACGTAYTEQQYAQEILPSCGRCGGSLDKLTLVIGRREPTT